ncbi:MAG: hypothetical protein HOK63_03100 [Thaumarchaeota archaeon]|jgi:hypothetical protein|nr:hypothetical protein [Nitrososphaerota archaeon]MBT6468626.1 hypothetical protein [Nitrososphaerota archaeon]
MNKRGIIIFVTGLVLIGISLSLASSVIPSDVTGPNDVSMSILFEGMFDEISDETLIEPGYSIFTSFGVHSSNVPVLWGIQIVDYQPGDKLSIAISNIFGDDYGVFVLDDPMLFELLEIEQSDTLNFEIQNLGDRNVHVVTMFSEDPENSDAFSDSNSPAMKMVYPLAISGILLLIGIVILMIGVFVILVDLKNYQNNKRSY